MTVRAAGRPAAEVVVRLSSPFSVFDIVEGLAVHDVPSYDSTEQSSFLWHVLC